MVRLYTMTLESSTGEEACLSCAGRAAISALDKPQARLYGSRMAKEKQGTIASRISRVLAERIIRGELAPDSRLRRRLNIANPSSCSRRRTCLLMPG